MNAVTTLAPLAAADFGAYYATVHGFTPFPWQQALVDHLAAGRGWPQALDLPTAAGKTSALDAALFHLALEAGLPPAERRAPLRIALVVDRRLVVDGAFTHAGRIAAALGAAETAPTAAPVLRTVAARLRVLAGTTAGSPAPVLAVERLRGGVPRENAWAGSPCQPLLLLSTVDQLGSRLLFRGYGLSEFAWPLHAGLLGEDTLILLDEAHLSQPFHDTVRAIRRYCGADWRETPPLRPVAIVPLSATQGAAEAGDALRLTPADRAHPELARRLRAAKPAELLACRAEVFIDRLADSARRLLAACPTTATTTTPHSPGDTADLFAAPAPAAPVVGIVVNRIATARALYAELRATGDADALLLIGRMRPLDRDRLVEAYLPRIRAGRAAGDNPRPLYVVATQTIEVGADLDFDALVTESAPLDALRQRFGRLNRLGARSRAPAAILHVSDAGKDDPVYGGAIAATWKWLNAVAVQPAKSKTRGQPAAVPGVDFGIEALAARLREVAPGADCLSPRPQAPVLLPMHVDLLARTSPAPLPSPEPALWLHGPQTTPAEVQLIWRADLPQLHADETGDLDDDGRVERARELVAALPPSSLEALSLPVWSVRAWLAGDPPPDEGSDLEGGSVPEDVPLRGGRRALRWSSDGATPVGPRAIRPGDTLIVPAAWGGLDVAAGGAWNPALREAVPDLAEAAARRTHGRTVLRLGPACVAQWRLMLRTGADAEAQAAAVAEAAQQLRKLFAEADDNPPDARTVLDELRGIAALPVPVCAALDALAAPGRPPRLLRYGARTQDAELSGWLLAEARPERVAADDGDDASLTVRVGLEAHCRGVGDQASRFAETLGLPPALVDDLGLAGDLHDAGKADPRFQAWLYGGTAPPAAPLLAKSGSLDRLDRQAVASARDLAGYPRGGRHECASVQLLRAYPGLLATAHDPELVEHLVGSHHGRGRPFLPVIDDPGAATLDASFELFDRRLRLRGPHGLERLDSGWPERFARLQRRYGWWGLAWLEALLRLADHRRSEDERRMRQEETDHE